MRLRGSPRISKKYTGKKEKKKNDMHLSFPLREGENNSTLLTFIGKAPAGNPCMLNDRMTSA